MSGNSSSSSHTVVVDSEFSVESPCVFAKISLKTHIVPAEEDAKENDYELPNFLQQPLVYQEQYADSHSKAGKKFRYLLFDDPNPGGFTIEEQSTPDLTILSPARQNGYYSIIVNVTLYNEEPHDLAESLLGILQNNKHIVDLQRRNMLIIITADGLFELLDNPLMIEFLISFKLFSLADIIQFKIKKKERLLSDKCYSFESRLCLNKAENQILHDEHNSLEGVDTLLIVKHENMRKIHSHLWLFYGFAFQLAPEYVFVVDVGTRPKHSAMLHLTEYMDQHTETSGACGELTVQRPKGFSPLLRTQWFEYKLQHILVKTFESVCGFIPVLPGAFSVYRWRIFELDDFSVLRVYLRPFTEPYKLTWVEWNVFFLAEDRIASERIMKLKEPSTKGCCNQGHYLRFVKQAKAVTDGQKVYKDLLTQRRRWHNGAWFALIQVVFMNWTLRDLWRSSHNVFAILFLLIQIVFYLLLIVFTWFSLGAYYFVFSLAVRTLFDSELWIEVLRTGFLFLDFSVMAFSLTVHAKYIWNGVWWTLSVIYMITFVFILSAFTYYLVENGIEDRIIFYAVILAPSILLVSIVIYGEDYLDLLKNSIPYIAMIPTYSNLFLIFAVSKTDDVTWGTRRQRSHKPPKQTHFKQYKVYYLLAFITSNIAFGSFLERTFLEDILYPLYTLYFITLSALILPFLGEIAYLLINVKIWCQLTRPKKVRPSNKRVLSKAIDEHEDADSNIIYTDSVGY